MIDLPERNMSHCDFPASAAIHDLVSIVHQQSQTISNLEEKLDSLKEEKLNLTDRFYELQEKLDQQKTVQMARYTNSEFCLAQAEFILPAKRARHFKSGLIPFDRPLDRCLDVKHLLEPATNLVYHKLHETTKDAQIRMRQSNDDLLAWKFSPESSIGKRLMSRVRHLLEANEELGRVNQADRVSVLESEADVQSTCMKELIKTHEGIGTVLDEAHADVEELQSSLLILHQQISQAESIAEDLQNELEARQPGRSAELLTALLLKLSETEAESQAADDENDDNDSKGEHPQKHSTSPVAIETGSAQIQTEKETNS